MPEDPENRKWSDDELAAGKEALRHWFPTAGGVTLSQAAEAVMNAVRNAWHERNRRLAEEEEARAREALARHYPDPDIPSNGRYGPLGTVHYSTKGGNATRFHVCYIDGTEIDGHRDAHNSGACDFCSQPLYG